MEKDSYKSQLVRIQKDDRYRESCLRTRKGSPPSESPGFAEEGFRSFRGKRGAARQKGGPQIPADRGPSLSVRFPHWPLNFQSVTCRLLTNLELPFCNPIPQLSQVAPFPYPVHTEDPRPPPPCGNGLSHSFVNRLPATRCPYSRLSANWRATTMTSPGSMALEERGLGCRRYGRNPVHEGRVNR